jgi:hypothetical protein
LTNKEKALLHANGSSRKNRGIKIFLLICWQCNLPAKEKVKRKENRIQI